MRPRDVYQGGARNDTACALAAIDSFAQPFSREVHRIRAGPRSAAEPPDTDRPPRASRGGEWFGGTGQPLRRRIRPRENHAACHAAPSATYSPGVGTWTVRRWPARSGGPLPSVRHRRPAGLARARCALRAG